MSAFLRRILLLAFLPLVSTSVTGCGSGVDGTYHDANGVTTLELDSGKAKLSMAGETLDLTYQVEGDKIMVHNPAEAEGEDLVLTRNSDGTHSGPLGTLAKK